MKVGTICRLKVDCLGNKAGTLGVVFSDYGNGCQVIFKNGHYGGFALLDEGLSFGASPAESDYFLEEVGFEESLAGYQFKNVMQVSKDYRKGLFDIVWSEGWKKSAETAKPEPQEYEKCQVYADGNRPAWLRFKRDIGEDITKRCHMLSAAIDYTDFSHFEYASLGKSICPRWIQGDKTLYPQFVVFRKEL